MARPFLFLDRDGTLIEERAYLSDPDGVQLTPGAAEALRQVRDAGWGVVLVTNQSGIARGLMTREQVDAVNARLVTLLEAEGVELDGIYLCPHGPEDGCKCRKPGTGLVLEAARQHDVDLLESVVAGDKVADLELAHAVGSRAVLVRTGYGRETEEKSSTADAVIDDLRGLADLLRDWTGVAGAAAFAARHLEESARTFLAVRESGLDSLAQAATLLADAMRGGGKLLICGNGGSAADSQHLAAEFVVRLSGHFERRAWPAIALTTDTSVLTAFGNDYGFERVFARQVEALGNPGDVLLAISTSGTSSNVVQAVEAARKRGVKVIGLLGGSGGPIIEVADVAIVVPSRATQHIQEAHLALYHLLCGLVERMLYPAGE